VVAAERPKLAPHKETIRARIGEILRTDPNQINVKAKTGEGAGPVGREETIEARCIALVESIA
jgi:2-C-methyl-D-erythritol 2,4-cyclodiphosphate synthase